MSQGFSFANFARAKAGPIIHSHSYTNDGWAHAKEGAAALATAPSFASIHFMPSRTRPMTFPRIWQSGTMIGSMVSFSGWRRMWPFSL